MNDLKEIRTGVIGVGSMGQHHARIFNEISNLVGVSDLNEDIGNKVASRFGVKYFKNYEEMIDKIDAVTISVPTKVHRLIAENVIHKKKHLLIEKPLAGSLEESQKILSLANKEDIILAVGHVERYNPVVSFVKTRLSNGEWGKLISTNSKRLSSFPARILDVGVVFDLFIHDIDIISHIVNSPISSLYAKSLKIKAANEDYASLIISHDSGVISNFETTWHSPVKKRSLQILTTKFLIDIDYSNQSIILSRPGEDNFDSIEVPKKNPLKLELLDFLESIVENRLPLVSGHDGIEAVRYTEAAVYSSKKNKVIHF